MKRSILEIAGLKCTLSLFQNIVKNVAVSWKHKTDATLELGHS